MDSKSFVKVESPSRNLKFLKSPNPSIDFSNVGDDIYVRGNRVSFDITALILSFILGLVIERQWEVTLTVERLVLNNLKRRRKQ